MLPKGSVSSKSDTSRSCRPATVSLNRWPGMVPRAGWPMDGGGGPQGVAGREAAESPFLQRCGTVTIFYAPGSDF
jgi:hypothetical protein